MEAVSLKQVAGEEEFKIEPSGWVTDRFGIPLGHVQYMRDDSRNAREQRVREQWRRWLER